jgi:hypothetical protein
MEVLSIPLLSCGLMTSQTRSDMPVIVRNWRAPSSLTSEENPTKAKSRVVRRVWRLMRHIRCFRALGCGSVAMPKVPRRSGAAGGCASWLISGACHAFPFISIQPAIRGRRVGGVVSRSGAGGESARDVVIVVERDPLAGRRGATVVGRRGQVLARLKVGRWERVRSLAHHRMSCTEKYATGNISSTAAVASQLRTNAATNAAS